ncbi:hypothetical protein AGR56_05195 [Clostridium sp. DMHC 10]|uniref:hypothetical protein n=1 Tax=Clostridium sp. DMHC 10 TaxID=747377 RepID=UPI00069D3612|nr:hypothetical protein [Clostridium sp. DMHC 10]KOF56261.1 hypothetical protein AGR56_05195 [Clostridium sp. DMHC 10]
MKMEVQKLLVDSVRREIGLPTAATLMCKTVPQSDIYKYLYNQYDGDIIKIIDGNTGKVVQQYIYDMDTDTKWVMIGGN